MGKQWHNRQSMECENWIFAIKKPFFLHTCTSMYIVALCTIVKTWTQPKCPTEEWIEEAVHIYNGIVLSQKRIK